MANPIVLSIPGFFVMMGAEWLIARKRRQEIYALDDTVANLELGIGQQVTGVMSMGVMFSLYVLIYEALAPWALPADSIAVWVGAFVVQDFLYYWFHRLSHQIGFMWAAHAVHHQSERYNLSVALRQSWLQPFISNWFYLPMALLGVPPLVYGTVAAINTLYQFWIHTELIGRMGWLEKIINTPSHHRVHHGTDPEYVDRNHGGMLIIWDKLFGTFIEEKQTPRYGTLAPVRSFEPFWANAQVWTLMWHKARAAERWSDKLKVFFAPPGWTPPGVELPPPPAGRPTDPDYRLYAQPRSTSRSVYIALQFGGLIAGTLAFLFGAPQMSPSQILLTGGALLWTLLAIGAVVDRRRWGAWVEAARLAAMVAIGAGMWTTDTHPTLGAALFVGGLLSTALGAWTARHHQEPATDPQRA